MTSGATGDTIESMYVQAHPPFHHTLVIYGLAVSSEPERIRYVGQTMRLSDRIKNHKQNSKKPSTPVHYWVSSKPEDDLLVYILEQCAAFEELDTSEMEWVSRLDTFIGTSETGGLNCDRGGKGVNSAGYRHSTETKKALSNANKGENASNAILTESQVIEIRRRYFSERLRPQELSETFGVSVSTINGIVKRRKWTHLPELEDEKLYVKKRSEKALLSDEQVIDIRKRLDGGDPVSSVAKDFDISGAAIYFIRDRVTYKDV